MTMRSGYSQAEMERGRNLNEKINQIKNKFFNSDISARSNFKNAVKQIVGIIEERTCSHKGLRYEVFFNRINTI